MGGSKAPAPPDYTQTAKQQADLQNQFLQQQTQANRPNQFNPTGSSQWTQDPSTGQWTQNVSFSPTMQGLWDQYTGNIAQQGQAAGGMLSSFTGNNDQYTGIENDLLQKGMGLDQAGAQAAFQARQQPTLDARTNALNASLAAQGMSPGSVAYNQAQTLNTQGLNDALNSAILNSGQWAGQQLSNLGSQYQMANALRTQPLSDYMNLMQGTQVSQPAFSGFTNAGQAQAPNLMGAQQATYQSQLDQYNANKASGSGIGGMLGTVVGGVAGSIIPGAGTMAGASMGGALGGMMGGMF